MTMIIICTQKKTQEGERIFRVIIWQMYNKKKYKEKDMEETKVIFAW